ncbi:MAG TPA: HAD family hydrolase [Treponemataceae bacterium]|nr:HAD family hydrolase [Treponemataceae bacterium]
MRSRIDAVAFDIDGTLYPDPSLFVRLIPFVLRRGLWLAQFGRVRAEMRIWQEEHPGQTRSDFFEWQAGLLAKRTGRTPEEERERLDSLVYRGWQPVFSRVPLFPHVRECFLALKKDGLKLGLLSDFLPEQKGDVWGLAPLCEAVLGSENSGALKPSAAPFADLSKALGVPANRILYVGNSVRSDVRGASNAGMLTACIVSPLAWLLGKRIPEADISFYSYRQLERFVLE